MLRKHPITNDDCITVTGQANYLLQFPIMLYWAEICGLICHRTYTR